MIANIMRGFKKVLILLLLVVSNYSFSQVEINKEEPTKQEQRKLKRAQKIKEGKILFTPFLIPTYSPELGGLLAGGGLLSFKTNRKDSLIKRSSLPLTVAYTTTSAIVVTGILDSYWFKDKVRININFDYKDMPDHYWGVGYESAYYNHKSDTTTSYNRIWWSFHPRFLYQFKSNYFIGLDVDYNYTKGSKESKPVLNDSIYNIYNEKPLNSGLGFILRYDSRDYPVDARKGMLIDFRTTFYSPYLGGDNRYQIYLLDYRQFITMFSRPSVLAWEMKGRISKGNVPYGEMSQLGTPLDLRGYLWGRYRNNDMFYAMIEYRHKFLKKSRNESKHSFVSWLAGGKIFNIKNSANPHNKWLPNAGLGYRFEIQPKMYIRFDFGVGVKTYGMYVNFNQVF